jgi:hypothetical protein
MRSPALRMEISHKILVIPLVDLPSKKPYEYHPTWAYDDISHY